MSIGIFLSMSESGVRQFTTSQLIYIIALVSLLSFLAFFVYRFLTQAHESLFTTIITFIAISYFIPQIMSSVEKSQNFIQPVDYYILFKHYESKNDLIRVADYLKRCWCSRFVGRCCVFHGVAQTNNSCGSTLGRNL